MSLPKFSVRCRGSPYAYAARLIYLDYCIHTIYLAFKYTFSGYKLKTVVSCITADCSLIVSMRTNTQHNNLEYSNRLLWIVEESFPLSLLALRTHHSGQTASRRQRQALGFEDPGESIFSRSGTYFSNILFMLDISLVRLLTFEALLFK